MWCNVHKWSKHNMSEIVLIWLTILPQSLPFSAPYHPSSQLWRISFGMILCSHADQICLNSEALLLQKRQVFTPNVKLLQWLLLLYMTILVYLTSSPKTLDQRSWNYTCFFPHIMKPNLFKIFHGSHIVKPIYGHYSVSSGENDMKGWGGIRPFLGHF